MYVCMYANLCTYHLSYLHHIQFLSRRLAPLSVRTPRLGWPQNADQYLEAARHPWLVR